ATATPSPSPAPSGGARLRVLHASPDAPELAITVAGRPPFTLGYTDLSFYQSLPPGAQGVQVAVAGADGPPLIELSPTVEASQVVTLALANTLAQIQPLVLGDDLTPPAPGTVHLRLLHAAADAPAVDLAVAGGPVLFPNAGFGAVTAHTPLPAGGYTFEVRVAGATVPAVTTRPLTLDSGDIYTATLLGRSANNTLRLIVYPDNV
ncbi:MAG: DUF4397 domain-containing protein, partial [Chloroflexota bacterium]|nr:DUF4397 domain-containing protein [Chloroflexota bacterium]